MALAVPGTSNTLQNGFSIAGTAPKQTQPIDFSAINIQPAKTSQVAAVAPAVATPKTGLVQSPMPSTGQAQATIQTWPPMQPNPGLVPSAPPVQPNNGSNPSYSFPGLVGSLAQTSQQGTPQGQQYTGQVAQTAQGNLPIGQQAADIAANYGQQIADVGTQGARGEAGYRTTGTTPVAEGNAAVVAQTVAAQQQALAQGESAALQGTGQQLTAQQQAAQGFNQAGGLAQNQQQLTQSGLTSAGGLVQPSVAGYGQTSFNPQTQSFGTSGGQAGVSPNDPFYADMQTYANLLANNQGGALPPYITGNPALQAQVIQMAQQINPNFNYNAASGAGAAQQANAQLATGGVPQANFQVYQQGLNQLYSVGQQLQNVTSLGNLTLQNAQGNNVNPFDLTYADKTLAQFKSLLSSNGQATFNSNLAAFQSAAGALLATAPGETPSDVTAKVGTIVDGTMKLSALKAMLDAAQSEGAIRYQSQLGVVQGSHDQLINPGATGASNPQVSGSTGVTPSGITYTIE